MAQDSEFSEKIDPKDISLKTYMNLCGCFQCSRLDSRFGTWPSKEAAYECDNRKKDIEDHYRQRKSWEKGNKCPLALKRPLMSWAG